MGSLSFHLPARSGAITGSPAFTATAGHLFVFRNPNTNVRFNLLRVYFEWETIIGFAAAQEMALGLYMGTTAAIHTTGTVVTPQLLGSGSLPANVTHECKIATTAALTASGTPVVAAQPWSSGSYPEYAASALVPKGFIMREYMPPGGRLWLMAENGGTIIIGTPVAMGSGGVGTLNVEVDYDAILLDT